MKSIPFKCKFGHIVILSFQNREEKPSSIMCKECESIRERIDSGEKIFNHSHFGYKNMKIGKPNENEKAYRY